jgi:hypothetical protein
MNNSAQMLLFILLLVLTFAIGHWFYNNYEMVEEVKEVGFQGEAKTNNLLAAEFFLRKMGVEVQQVNALIGFRRLPSSDHTILITTQRETLNESLSANLINWVKEGGHLIVVARYSDKSEKVFDFLKTGKKNNQETQETQEDILLKDLSIYAKETKSKFNNEGIPVSLALPAGSAEPIDVNFPLKRTLARFVNKKAGYQADFIDPEWVVEDLLGKYLIQFSLQRGRLTVLNSAAMFTNDEINEFDHARFLHYLVQQQGNDAGVWLIRVDDMPALWHWLWGNAWYVMVSLLVLLLLWLWRSPLRFGPKLNDDNLARRSLLEHIQAGAYYRWHEGQSRLLLAKVQENLWEKIHIAHPAVRRENPAQAFAMLAEITNLDESRIRAALSPTSRIKEHEFTDLIKTLELIRRNL